MQSSSAAHLYTRSALLQWANKALTTSFATLDTIPAKAIALLLNAIHGHAQFPLNKIEFADVNRSDAQRRNCEVVVAQSASHLGYTGRLDASLWFAKEDTANELLFWRWVRQSAEGKGWMGCINVSNLLAGGNSSNITTPSASVVAAFSHQQEAMPSTSYINSRPGPTTNSIADGLSASNFLVDSITIGNTASFTDDEPAVRRPPRAESNYNTSDHYSQQYYSHSVTSVPVAVVTAAPTPVQIAASNAAVLQQTAHAVPVSREAEAYHSSRSALAAHLAAQHQLNQNASSSTSYDQENNAAFGMSTGMNGADTITNNSASFNPSQIPTDPYIAALIDAKNDKLLHLQSLRSRLISACHAKDRARVMEVMCEYMRAGGGVPRAGEEKLRMLV